MTAQAAFPNPQIDFSCQFVVLRRDAPAGQWMVWDILEMACGISEGQRRLRDFWPDYCRATPNQTLTMTRIFRSAGEEVRIPARAA